MPIQSLLLVVAAAFIHATWNLLGKRAAHIGAPFIFSYTLVSSVLYLPWVLWLMFYGHLSWTPGVWLCIALSGVLHIGYNFCLLHGYRVADLSVVYPVARGSAPLLSSLVAIVLFRERPSGLGLLGIAAVVGGVMLISIGPRGMPTKSSTARGVRWGAATGALIAGYTVVDAWAVKELAMQPVVLDWCTNVFRAGFLLPWMLHQPRDAWRPLRDRWHLALAVGALSPLAYILVLAALRLGGPVSLVAPAREMSMMIGALLGMIVLREPLGFTRLTGCALLVGGVVLLGLA